MRFAAIVMCCAAVRCEQGPESPEPAFDPSGEVSRAMIGIEQVGASSSDSTRKFFLDFYISRALPLERGNGAHRWWGNVRVGSQAIQTAAAISITPAGLLGAARELNLNTIAQAAEFQSGYEFQFARSSSAHASLDGRRHRAALGWIVGGGAALPLHPVSSGKAFDFPARGSYGYQRLLELAPELASAVTAPKHLVLTTPDRNSFLRSYFTGLRLSTFYECGGCTRSMGTVTATIGQNELITGGIFRGFVSQVEASYPLPLSWKGRDGASAGIFLFGRAAFRLNGAHRISPLFLTDADPAAVVIPETPLIARPSRRDIYTIGVGFDAIRVGRQFLGIER